MIKEAIAKLVKKEDLTAGQMNDVMEEIMTGEATDAQKAAFLTALAAKGETIDEITAPAGSLLSVIVCGIAFIYLKRRRRL